MANKWLEHLKAFHKANPQLSYKEAMKKAKQTYKSASDAVTKSPSPSPSKTAKKRSKSPKRNKSNRKRKNNGKSKTKSKK